MEACRSVMEEACGEANTTGLDLEAQARGIDCASIYILSSTTPALVPAPAASASAGNCQHAPRAVQPCRHARQIAALPCSNDVTRIAIEMHNTFEKQDGIHRDTIYSGLSLDTF
jgi:hypothetical protein